MMLSDLDVDPQRSATTKRRQWREYQELTAQLADVADGVVAAGLRLGGKPGRALKEAYENLHVAVGRAYPAGGGRGDRTMLDGILAAGLTPTVETDYERWRPLHWILAVPDVMERGGFDAVIGNPPFLGGTLISGAVGTNMLWWIGHVLAAGPGGRADIVAYFFLRAVSLLAPHGGLGLIATNTIAQGDTREVGLDRLVADGLVIARAVQSRSWPVTRANAEYSAVWGTRAAVSSDVERVADGVPVAQISTLLEPSGRIQGNPRRLTENRGITFEGCKPYGAGFLVDGSEAREWIQVDPANAQVLFPFLNADDLNSRPDSSPSRWVIDFNSRAESAAQNFQAPYRRLLERVKPERARKSPAVRGAPWWLFFRARPAMRKAIAGLGEILIIARVSKTLMPLRVAIGPVPSEATVVFALDSFSDQAVLSSSLHQMWSIKYGSGLRADPRYTPSDVFETFTRPESSDSLTEVGKTLDTERREIMLRRSLGLTKLYNLVNDPDIPDSADPDVARLRRVHVELDEAVMSAYGWEDVPLEHGFHTYRQMRRWTVSPTARVEILDRLLEENHRRAALQGEAPPPAEEIEGEGE